MLFDSSSVNHLKPWLVRTLEPICDAEPGALADYILALLKHNVPESEMRNELAVQLDEFLEKAACASFIDTLFTVLRTKSYLPYTASSPPSPFATKPLDTGIPIPLDGLLSPSISDSPDRNRKRSIENDERDGRPPAKGPRLSTEGQFSRYTNGYGGRPEGRSTGGWSSRAERPPANGYRDNMDMYGGGLGIMGAMGMQGMNGMGPIHNRRPQSYQPPDQKRGICRDYHNNGYCARGAMCKYSHGEDAVVPGQLYPMNPALAGVAMPFLPMFPGAMPFGMGGGVGGAYDPHESRMDMRPVGGRPQQRAPLLPRIQQEDGSQVVQSVHTSGELPVIQDLTPTIPVEEKSDPQAQSSMDQQPPEALSESQSGERVGYGSRRNGGMNGQPYMNNMNMAMDIDPSSMMGMPGNQQSHSFRPVRGGGRGRGGTFGGDSHSFRPERRNDKTLVVEKIPEDKMTLEHVNGWFKRFGTVTNVAIDSSNAKALISFATHDEAYAAWKSEDAVFNNRFVKLFWHRPMEGHGQVGARMLAASAPLVANISNPEPPARPAPPPTTTPSRGRKSSTTVSTLAAKQQQLEQQIAEQKSLMESLSTASPGEKKSIMARLRKLGEEMKPPSMDVISTIGTKPAGATNKTNDHERKERERLDKELELHNTSGGTEGESSQDLAAKLEKLKAEAASLGIIDTSAEPVYGGNLYSYRGRGRGGRGYHRGGMRGEAPRGSMKLDNRPKKLLVKGVPGEGVPTVRDWFETNGQMESLETIDSGDIIVTFKSRAAAEQGLAKGHNLPTVGPVQISWYTGQTIKATPVTKTASPETTPVSGADSLMSDVARPRSPEPPAVHSPRIQEEEVVASGWGADSDGEDGMGML